MKAVPPSRRCSKEFDILTSFSYWLVRSNVNQDFNRCPFGSKGLNTAQSDTDTERKGRAFAIWGGSLTEARHLPLA
jgi:hypothetical protein